MSINKVILIGNLGRDPEIKYANNGNAIASLALATTKKWTDKQTGQKHEKTEWHRVSVFNQNLAQIVQQYTKKGSKLYIEGELETNKWQDKQGNDRYTTQISVGFNGVIDMLDSKGTMPEQQQSNSVPVPKPARSPHVEAGSIPGDQGRDEFDDDIPFN
jgi:single-strand DNA-binding protein